MGQYGGNSSLQFIPSQKNTIDLHKTQRVDLMSGSKNVQGFLDAKKDSEASVLSLNQQLQGMHKNLVSLMFMGPYDKQLLQQQRLDESLLQSDQQFHSNMMGK